MEFSFKNWGFGIRKIWDLGLGLALKNFGFGIDFEKFGIGIWDWKRIISGLGWDRDPECRPLQINRCCVKENILRDRSRIRSIKIPWSNFPIGNLPVCVVSVPP